MLVLSITHLSNTHLTFPLHQIIVGNFMDTSACVRCNLNKNLVFNGYYVSFVDWLLFP